MKRLTIVAAVAALVLAQGAAVAGERVGSFIGASKHATSGTVSVNQNGRSATLTLARNFSFDGAPDPKLAFGNHATADRRTIFAPLKSNTGAQTYRVPAGIDPADYSHVYLWCERFGVPLGVARLRGN